MTIIVFLIDTSVSMNQRTYLGARNTLMDVAKGAVEQFIKFRKRDSSSSGDRYMLITFEEPPSNIKAGWKENQQTFSNELKNLQAYGLSNFGSALKHAFDILNINRMQTGIDTYGQGRCPFYLEPSVIIMITDGGKFSTQSGAQGDFTLPMQALIPGLELTREPFRWDQRLFALVLRLSGTPPPERDPPTLVPSDSSPIDAMCEVTGGKYCRSFAVTSHRTLLQCLESIVQKLQAGVVINFEKSGPDPPPLPNEGTKSGLDASSALSNSDISALDNANNDMEEVVMPSVLSDDENKENNDRNDEMHRLDPSGLVINPNASSINIQNNAWHCCRKMIYVQRSAQKGYSVGHWPIPEAFWPDVNSSSLPPRTAQPIIKFTCSSHEPLIIDNMPFDKYELEPSPLTQYLLSRKQPNVCWQVFVANSNRNNDIGCSFGYLKASTNLACVNLYVMPYNYPVLLPLLDELVKIHRLKPTREWKSAFDNYLKSMPLYYSPLLKRALQRMGAPNLIPDSMDNCLSYNVTSYLKRIKSAAKQEHEKLISSVGSGKNITPDSIRVTPTSGGKISQNFKKLADLTRISNPAFAERFKNLINELNEFNGFKILMKEPDIRPQSYRNPFDITREGLLDQTARMRANFLQPFPSNSKLVDDDQLHNQSIGQMGNYQDYIKRMPQPLREIDSTPPRQHMFGNPFKIDKRMMVDEADVGVLDILAANSPGNDRRAQKRTIDAMPGSPRPSKRKIGPIPRDFVLKRPMSPQQSPVYECQYPKDSISEDDQYDCKENSLVINEDPIDIPELIISNGDRNVHENTQEDEDLPPPVLELNHNNEDLLQENHLSNNHISDDPQLTPPDLIAANGIYGRMLDVSLDCGQFQEENTKLKHLLFKEVRRYGKSMKEEFMDVIMAFRLNNNLINKSIGVEIKLLRINCVITTDTLDGYKLVLFYLKESTCLLISYYNKLFNLLEQIQGSVENRKSFIGCVITEATRFKRKKNGIYA
ncbi:Integrator complex subunit 6-A [Nymphon striatum]|nr:Integrator complex subunit 6-A [Nymphon striatum]